MRGVALSRSIRAEARTRGAVARGRNGMVGEGYNDRTFQVAGPQTRPMLVTYRLKLGVDVDNLGDSGLPTVGRTRVVLCDARRIS